MDPSPKPKTNKPLPDWAKPWADKGFPLVLGSDGIISLEMDVEVPFKEINWDSEYSGHPLGGWNVLDAPPTPTHLRIHVGIRNGDNYNGVYYKPNKIGGVAAPSGLHPSQTMSSSIFPHSKPSGSCYHPNGNQGLITTIDEMNAYVGRIVRFLGGANMASLLSPWCDWPKTVHAAFPPAVRTIMEKHYFSPPGNLCRADLVKSYVPFDYTYDDLKPETWHTNSKDEDF